MTDFYRKSYRATAGFFRWFYKLKVIGVENVPQTGGVILAPNHTTDVDVIVVAAAVGRQVRYMAKAELFRVPLLGKLISKLGAFPVNRGKNDVSSVKQTLSLLESGEAVGLFPQGTRCPGTDPREAKVLGGVAMIASRAAVPVVPTLILTKKMKVLPFRRTYVIFGEAVTPGTLREWCGESGTGYRQAAERIFARVGALLPPDYRLGTLPALPGKTEQTDMPEKPENGKDE